MTTPVNQLKALANETRSEIMLELAGSTSGLSNSELMRRLPHVTKGKMSEHLTALRDAGLITTRTSGRHRYHQINDPELDRIHQFLTHLLTGDPS